MNPSTSPYMTYSSNSSYPPTYHTQHIHSSSSNSSSSGYFPSSVYSHNPVSPYSNLLPQQTYGHTITNLPPSVTTTPIMPYYQGYSPQYYPQQQGTSSSWNMPDWNSLTYQQQQAYYSTLQEQQISSPNNTFSAPPPPSTEHIPPPPPPPQQPTQPPPPVPRDVGKEFQEEMKKLEEESKKIENVKKESIEEMQLRKEKEEQDRIRRIEAENKKKRKLPNARQLPSQRMRKVELDAFQDTDDLPKLAPLEPLEPSPILVSLAPTAQSLLNEELTQSQRDTILKTAVWVSKNEDKLPNLIQNSRENEKLRFLSEPNTPAGRLFYSELEKLQVQRTVREVCAGDGNQDDSSLSSPIGSSSDGVIGSLSREEIQRAGREAALIALSMKRGLLTSALSYTIQGSRSVDSAVTPSSVPAPAAPEGTIVEKKKEKRNRWGPAVNPLSTPIPITHPLTENK